MDKNSIIGFALIGVIFFGFTWYQSRQYKAQREIQAQIDSAARAEQALKLVEEAAAEPEIAEVTATEAKESPVRASSHGTYRDSALNAAASAENSYVTLANDKVEIVFSTKGAQPYSVKIKDFRTYDSTDLYLVKPGMSSYGISVFAGENIDTRNFVFDVAGHTDSTLTMRLPFSNGGYIEQRFSLPQGSYMMANELSFIGLDGLIPRKINSADIDWTVIIPRLEKGYSNEKQYSKVNYYFSGEKKPEQLGRGGRNDEEQIVSKVKWFAFENRNDISIPFDFYFGPNHYRTLKDYDLKYEKIIPLGGSVIGLVSRWIIIPTFNFLGKFISSYGIIILLMTIFIKLIVSPLTIKSYISSAKMAVLKPDIDKLNEKYPKQEDALKKQQEMMDLYQRAGISPMGGCLPMLLQLPILYAMFRFFPASIELRQQPFLWADDLSAYDSILNLPFNIPLYGDHVSLFALLMAVSMFMYSKMTSSQMSNDPNMAGMKFMSVWLMPIMMLFICNNLSSGLSYYYLLSNLITMLQTWIIRKYVVDEKKIHAELAASAGKPRKKSKWQQRLEEAQRMQQQALREQQKKKK